MILFLISELFGAQKRAHGSGACAFARHPAPYELNRARDYISFGTETMAGPARGSLSPWSALFSHFCFIFALLFILRKILNIDIKKHLTQNLEKKC